MSIHASYNEKDLLKRLSAGDVKTYEALYNQYYYTIFHFARTYVENRAVAEDIVTDAFVKLWRKRADFETIPGIKSFLLMVTRNACFNYLRDEKKHAAVHQELSMFASVERDATHQQIAEKIYEYLEEEIAKLPPKMKMILQLHLKGYKNEEIAKQLELSEKTVRNLKVEAIKQLRITVLKNDWLLLLLFLL